MKHLPISFCLLLLFLILSGSSYTQVYSSLTDSLLKHNRVRTRTRITMDNHIAERWYYYENGNESQHISYYPTAPNQRDPRPMMSTYLTYDSAKRLTTINTEVMEDYQDKKIMLDVLGHWLVASRIVFKYDSVGKLKEELHTGWMAHSESESLYSVNYDYTPDGKKIKKTITDLSGIIRDQWVYDDTAAENKEVQTTYNATGKIIRVQMRYYEKPDIISRIILGDMIVTFQNRFNKKGQLVKTIRKNNTGKTEFQFSYLHNGLLEKITGSKNYWEISMFDYQYY